MVPLPGLTRGDKSFELALIPLAFVCFTGVVFAATADLVEVFVAGFGFVIPVFTLSDFGAIVLLGITWLGGYFIQPNREEIQLMHLCPNMEIN